MKFRIFILLFISVLFYSCTKNPKSNLHKFFNETNLQEQLFEINVTRDTTLLTASGCILRIATGSLQSDNKNVKLEIKEAIHLKDILLAGLTTKSGNKTLSSAGMIYLNVAKGYKATIIKPIEVLVPSETYNPAMQVFKGKKQDNGNIDWQNPTALAADETSKKIGIGEQIFKAQCSNCHKIEQDYTGPALIGITYRKPKKWIYDFMKSPENMIITDCYSKEQFDKWKPTVMTAFPALESGGGLDSLFAHIKAESDKRGMGNIKYEKTCCDSCYEYKEALAKINNKRNKLIEDNGAMFNLDRVIPVPADPNLDTIAFTESIEVENPKKYISPTSVKATYYTIKMEAFGWHNLDFGLSELDVCKESELFVRMQGQYKLEYNVCLIIPSRKVFVEGGKLEDGEQYGFKETNGKIILPQKEQCYVVAFAAYKDKFIFGKTLFSAGLKQTITVATKEMTKEEMEKEFALLDLEDVKMKVDKSKNSDKIRQTDKKLDAIQKLLPKNCDCIINGKIQTEPILADAVFSSTLKKGEKQDYTDTIF